ncbi:response regulator [Bdellovibrionota bacterium FG-2]
MLETSSRILVVDDSLSLRKIMAVMIRGGGYQDVIEAANGEKAWEVLTQSEKPVSLIVCDWMMPVCTGLDFLKKLRADPRFQSVPFFMLTAEADDERKVEALAAGATDYLMKPFTAQVLREKVAGLSAQSAQAA